MNKNRYLLYIDILGFSELVRNDSQKIQNLYQIIDILNSHKHSDFQTIIFSDTILIFNKIAAISLKDHEYIVMYACEFAQDLLFKLRNENIFFRAILTYGEFSYTKMVNCETYYGEALINAYTKEKNIVGMGLYLDKKISKFNNIFNTVGFDNDFDFVFLLQTIEGLKKLGITEFPTSRDLVEQGYLFYRFDDEIKIISALRKNVEVQKDSKIRGKYLQTYTLYRNRYVELIQYLETNNFKFNSVSPDANWKNVISDKIE